MRRIISKSLGNIVLGTSFILFGSGDYFTSTSKIAYSQNLEDELGKKTLINKIGPIIDKTTLETFKLIGIQGGYTNSRPDSFRSITNNRNEKFFLSYFYDRGNFGIPEYIKDDAPEGYNEEESYKNPLPMKLIGIEKQISEYLDNRLPVEVSRLENFPFRKENIIFKSTSKVEKGKIIMKYNMTFKEPRSKETQISFSFETRPIEFKSKLYEMFEIAEYITQSHKRNTEFFCISCVSDMADKRGLEVQMTGTDLEDTTLVKIGLYDGGSVTSLGSGSSTLSSKNNDGIIQEEFVNSYPRIFYFLNRYPSKKENGNNLLIAPAPPEEDN